MHARPAVGAGTLKRGYLMLQTAKWSRGVAVNDDQFGYFYTATVIYNFRPQRCCYRVNEWQKTPFGFTLKCRQSPETFHSESDSVIVDGSHFSGEAAEFVLCFGFMLTATSARRRAGLNHLVAPETAAALAD